MKIISLIVPCYNEELTINAFYQEIKTVIGSIPDTSFELFFINDGSKDKTLNIIKGLHEADSRVKCISFSRNFGKEAALFAGIRAVTGDCSVILDADLQHPPKVIIEMFQLWKNGYDVVEGLKSSRGKESIFHTLFSKLFYGLISKAIGLNMRNSSDFKLLDKKVVAELAKLKERNTFFRALSFWVGYKRVSVYYETQNRVAGVSKWSVSSLIRYALQNIVSFTYTPLHLITIIGSVFLFIGALVGIDALVSFIRKQTASGYPTLVFLILLATGSIMCSLGIVGVYIAKIYDEIKGRPPYIIDQKLD